MAYFIYPDNDDKEPFRGRPKPYHEQPAVDYWFKHYQNSKYLTFMAQHRETSALERAQATKELEACQRKMDYWKRHVNWNAKQAGLLAQEIDKQWQPK
jgi:hypothetical protein